MSDRGGPAPAPSPTGAVSLPLAKATIVIGGFSMVNAAVGLVRGKYAAEVLGTAGVGLLSQANSFFLLAAVVCALGVAAGVVKRVAAAAAAGDGEAARDVIATAFTAQMLVTGAFVLVSAAAIGPLYTALFPTGGLELPFLLVLVGLPFSVVASGVLDPVFFGLGRYDLYTKASAAGVVLGLLPFVVFIHFGGVAGAIVAIPVAAVLRLACFVYYARQLDLGRPLFRLRLEVGTLRHLGRYGVATFVVAAASALVALLVRSNVIHVLGEDANGLYQVPIAFAGYYAPFLTNGLWGHLYPYVSARGAAETRDEADRAVGMSVLAVAAVALGLLLVQDWLIPLVFSRRFVAANTFLPIQLLGDLFYFPAFTLGVVMLGLGRLRVYVATSVAFYALQAVLTFALLPHFELRGAALAYAASALAYLGVAAGLYYGRIAVTPPGRNTSLLAVLSLLALGADVAVILAGGEWWLRLVITGAWLAAAATRPEAGELIACGVRHGLRLTTRLRRRVGWGVGRG